MLFSEDGVKRMLEFGRRIGWRERKWGEWKGKEGVERKGRLLNQRVIGGKGS